MKVVIENPNGNPYLTLREDGNRAYIQIHDYDYIGTPVEFNFDIRTIPALIEGLTKLKKERMNERERLEELTRVTLDAKAGSERFCKKHLAEDQ